MCIERAARGLGLACAFKAIDAGGGAHMLVENERVGEDLLDLFDAIEDVDQARVVVVERALHRADGELLELGEFLVGLRRAHGSWRC